MPRASENYAGAQPLAWGVFLLDENPGLEFLIDENRFFRTEAVESPFQQGKSNEIPHLWVRAFLDLDPEYYARMTIVVTDGSDVCSSLFCDQQAVVLLSRKAVQPFRESADQHGID